MFACAGIICLCSCQQKKQPKQPVENIPHTGSVPLIDDGPPLSEIAKMIWIGHDSILVTDRSSQFQLFVNYRFAKVVGKKGKGPGEYVSMWYFQAIGDTVFVFDRRSGKIIEYSLETGEVYDEVVNTNLIQFTGFLRANGTFYFGYSTYTGEPKSEKCLLYQLDEHNKLIELNFRYSDLGSDKIVFADSPAATVLMKAKGEFLYVIWPFSPRIWIYDLRKNKIESFKLELDYPRQTDLRNGTDLQTQAKFLEQIEMVTDLFLTNRGITLYTVVPKFGKFPTKETSRLRLYTYAGKELTHFNVSPSVWHAEDSLLIRWGVNTSQSEARYPYLITWETY